MMDFRKSNPTLLSRAAKARALIADGKPFRSALTEAGLTPMEFQYARTIEKSDTWEQELRTRRKDAAPQKSS